jgi:hypothetical protein
MQWEVKKLPDGRWGIFLCKKYWKFKDKPVMYAASITKEGAEQRVNRLNDPNSYDFDIGYVTVKQAREAERKKKAEARELEKQKKKEARELAKKKRAEAAKAKKEAKKK